jgi:hypothetical protein
MRRYISGTRGTLIAVIAGAAVLVWSASSLAGTPTLGSDCGAGAALVGTSSDEAGKVTLGTDPATCTFTFGTPYTNAPACTATDETSARTVAVSSTTAGMVLNGPYPFSGGDVVSYICVEY